MSACDVRGCEREALISDRRRKTSAQGAITWVVVRYCAEHHSQAAAFQRQRSAA